MEWRNFVAIYDTNEGLSRLQKTLQLKGKKDSPITHTIRQLNEESNYRQILKEIRSLSVCNIVIDVKPQKIEKILTHAKEVNLLSDYCHLVITYLVSIYLLNYLLNFNNKTVLSNAMYSTGPKRPVRR